MLSWPKFSREVYQAPERELAKRLARGSHLLPRSGWVQPHCAAVSGRKGFSPAHLVSGVGATPWDCAHSLNQTLSSILSYKAYLNQYKNRFCALSLAVAGYRL